MSIPQETIDDTQILMSVGQTIEREFWSIDERLRDRISVNHTQILLLREIQRDGRISGGILRKRLNLDKSTLSRALKDLQGKGWIAIQKDEDDSRNNLLSLTNEGYTTVNEIQDLTEKQVKRALLFLSENDKRNLEAVLPHFEAALKLGRNLDQEHISLNPIEEEDSKKIASIIKSAFGEHASSYFQYDKEYENLFEHYSEEAYFFTLKKRSRIIGGLGLRPLEQQPDILSINKLFIIPEFRGQKLGRFLLNHAIRFAEENDYRGCHANVPHSLEPAHRLLEKSGFKESEMDIEPSRVEVEKSLLKLF